MRECEFIKAEGRIWVPQPSSWLGGWARHRWLERHFGEGVLSIASADTWADLRISGRPVWILQEQNNEYLEVSKKTS